MQDVLFEIRILLTGVVMTSDNHMYIFQSILNTNLRNIYIHVFEFESI